MFNNTHNLVPGPSGSRQYDEDEPMRGPCGIGRRVKNKPMRGPSGIGRQVKDEPMRRPSGIGRRVKDEPMRRPNGIGRRVKDEPMRRPSGIGRQVKDEPIRRPSGIGRRVKDEPMTGPSGNWRKDEDGDFSASSSDWLPSDNDFQRSDSDEEMPVYHQRDQKGLNNNIILKAKAVVENINPQKILEQIQNMLNVEHSSVASNSQRYSLPGSVVLPVNKEDVDKIFRKVFAIMANKSKIQNCLRALGHNPNSSVQMLRQLQEERDENKENLETPEQQEVADNERKIPIGSGTTLVDKELFKKVNWKSYTVATRKLLLAVFKREELATCSLTGKPSPAFQNRRAKKCLDQRKIADIIFEITNRFDVSASDVRSIITTKCADECKMMRTRIQNAEQKRAIETPQKQEVGDH